MRVEIGDTGPGIPAELAAAHLRAVLHDQAGRPGHRARPRHLLPDRRRPPRRRPDRRVRARRHPVHRLPAADRTSVGLMAGGLRYSEPAGRWVLLATVLGSGTRLHRRHGRQHRAAAHRRAARRRRRRAAVDRQRLHADPGVAHPARRLAGRPLRPAPDLRHRRRLVRRWRRCSAASRRTSRLLVAARALQGVGGALLTPGSLAILQSSFARTTGCAAIGAWSGLGGIAGALGPFLGGWLVEVASWRWSS